MLSAESEDPGSIRGIHRGSRRKVTPIKRLFDLHRHHDLCISLSPNKFNDNEFMMLIIIAILSTNFPSLLVSP